MLVELISGIQVDLEDLLVLASLSCLGGQQHQEALKVPSFHVGLWLHVVPYPRRHPWVPLHLELQWDQHFLEVPCRQFFRQYQEHLEDLEVHLRLSPLVTRMVQEVLEDLLVPAFPCFQQGRCHLFLLVPLVDLAVLVHLWVLVVQMSLSLQEVHLALGVLFYHLAHQLPQFPWDPLLQACQQPQEVHLDQTALVLHDHL